MSIQQSKYRRFRILYTIFSKLKFLYVYDKYLKLIQYIFRKVFFLFNSKKSNLSVFFDYYHHYTHPDIKKRYYGKRAPLSWVDLKSSDIVHCIQSSSHRFTGKKVIIEPNDHVLVIGSSLGIKKPRETVERCKEISDFISSSTVSRVLVGDNDLIHHAKHYYLDNALKKFIVYPEFSCLVKVTASHLKNKSEKILTNRKIRFLSIASDFEKKAVDLLVEAFIESNSLGELILVCHNVSENIRSKILKTKNISLIEDIPLSNKKKDFLYRNSDVYINTTHIDGGAVAVNALEYGLPIITATYHRGKSYIKNDNGILLSEPMKYYDPSNYGIDWNGINDYLSQVDHLKKKGGYDKYKKQLINSLKHYEEQPNNILSHGIKSLELAQINSLEKSNKTLRDIYLQVSLE